MLGRLDDSERTIPQWWRSLLLAGLILLMGMFVLIRLMPNRTILAIESVGGEVIDPFEPQSATETFNSVIRFLLRNPTPKDLYLGPRDQNRVFLKQVYNDRLTDEAILRIDLSEIGNVRLVDMSGPHVTDRGFSHIAGSPLVFNLVCRNAKVTDAGLAALEKGSGLNHLDLTGNNITDAGISSLVRSPRLHGVLLNDTRITDQAILCLASSEHRISSLGIASTDVTNAGLVHLQKIPGLSGVWLDVVQFSDETVSILQPLNLGGVSIGTCSARKKREYSQQGMTFPSQVDDQVVMRIAKLKTLRSVGLFGGTLDEPANLTSEAVKAIRSMPNLTYLDFVDLAVDPAVVRQLRQQLPAMQIRFNGK